MKFLEFFRNRKLRREFSAITEKNSAIFLRGGRTSFEQDATIRMIGSLGSNAEEKIFEIYRLHREEADFSMTNVVNLYYKLVCSAVMFSDSILLERLRKTSSKNRLSIEDISRLNLSHESVMNVKNIMTFFELAGNPKQSILTLDMLMSISEKSESDMLDFYQRFPKPHSSVPCKMPNRLMETAQLSAESFGFGSIDVGYLTSVYLLRIIYGDNLVLELLERHRDESSSLQISQIPELLGNWEELCDYPLEWSLATLEKSEGMSV